MQLPKIFMNSVLSISLHNDSQMMYGIEVTCNPLATGGVSGISGMEWWNGPLEWNTRMDWDKIFALACNL